MKKMLIGLTGLVVVAGLVFGFRNVADMGGMAIDEAREMAQDAVPIDVQIRQLERELTDLAPEIEKAKKALVQQKLVVEDLNVDLEEKSTKVARQWGEIKELQAALKSRPAGTEFVKVGENGNQYTEPEVVASLERRMRHLKAEDRNLEALKASVAKNQQAHGSMKETLDNLIELKQTWAAEIEELKATYEMVKAKQVETRTDIDNSRIERFQEKLKQAQRRVREKQEMLELNTGEYKDIDLNPTPDKVSIMEEIDARRASEATDGKGTDLINVE